MNKEIKTLDDVVNVCDGILAKKNDSVDNVYIKDGLLTRRKNKTSSKSYLELNADELQKEIDYLWGQYDYICNSEDLPKDIKLRDGNIIWEKLDFYISRFICMNVRGDN